MGLLDAVDEDLDISEFKPSDIEFNSSKMDIDVKNSKPKPAA
jgi:hypothetical protein